jgi:hypothetical protein
MRLRIALNRKAIRIRAGVQRSASSEDIPQFVFGAFENTLLFLRQVFPGSIDVKIQHRASTRQNSRTRGKTDFRNAC